MLKIRVMPTLLWRGISLYKGEGFDSWRPVGTVLPAVKVYNTREVDELVVLDIRASEDGSEPDYEGVAEFSAECFVPLTVGGGITSIEQVKKLLRAGADKVVVNSAAYSDPDLITRAANAFGSQCIVVGIDARRDPGSGGWKLFSHNGKREQPADPVAWAQEVERRGAGEILLTSIERDGTLRGYDLELIRSVTAAVRIPVIASGGAGSYADFHAAIEQAGASAVAAAALFHFTEGTPKEAKRYLRERGLPVRT